MEAGVAVVGRSSFRKPAHAPSQRNYRRRSPSASSSRSSSSSRSPPAQPSSGGWKRDRGASPSSPKRAVGTNASASLQSKKGETSHTGKDGSDEDSQGGRLAEPGPGSSERHGRGRSYDRHNSKHDYHDYSRRPSASHYDRGYHRAAHGRHSNRDSYGDGRRNGDHDYVSRSSRRSPERGYRDRDSSWNRDRDRDRERHRSRDRGRDSEGRGRYRGESRGSYLEREREADVGGKIDQDFRERDRDREKDRIRDHEKSRGGRNGGRDVYSSRGDDSEHRYDESRDSKRDRDRGRVDQQRAYKSSRRSTREDSDDRDIEAGEFGRERSREREKLRDGGKEREREKLQQTKSSVRDVSSSNHVDRKQAESSDEEKFLDISGTNELDVQLDPETRGDTWERAREGGSLKERAEEKESRGVHGPRTDMDQDAERFGEKSRSRYVEAGTNRDHGDRRKERTRQGDEGNIYKGRDVTGKEQFKEDFSKDEDAWTESSVLRNKEHCRVQDVLSEDDEFVMGQANHTFSNRPDDGRSGSKAISTSDHGSYRDKDRGSSSGLDKASASDRLVFDETTNEKERAAVKSDGQQGNKAKQVVGASPSFAPKDKEGSRIRNHTKNNQENAPLISSLPSSTASDSDKKVIATSAGKGGKNSKWGPETSECSAEEVANDLNAAKLAAMKAAELVNKNLGVAGFMSADQKKRLLWGSKKVPTEQQEPAVASGTNRWDTVHFSDPDRQEKFHKLMGVKADTCPEPKKEGNLEAGLFTEEKQRELQQDLEKQFAAGLRRRDGGKVGLGL